MPIRPYTATTILKQRLIRAGALLDNVEMDDEKVVQGVQKDLQSRFYSTGRSSPTRDQGVHYFHILISETIREN